MGMMLKKPNDPLKNCSLEHALGYPSPGTNYDE